LRVGLFARLISDDQVILRVSGARLVARAVPAVMGLVEVRALGLVRVPHVSAAVVRLIVDIGAPAARLPLETELKDTLLGIELPRITVNEFLDAEMVLWWLRCADDALVTDP
jgi:HPr kinase/phosphorylase